MWPVPPAFSRAALRLGRLATMPAVTERTEAIEELAGRVAAAKEFL